MKLSDISKMKKDELIAFIAESNLRHEYQSIDSLPRKMLIELARKALNIGNIDSTPVEKDELSAVMSMTTQSPSTPAPRSPTISPTAYDWHNHVMACFDKQELLNGYPTADALRRVFEQLIGTIISSTVEVIQAPEVKNHRTATVVVKIKYVAHGTGYTCEISDVADCYEGNSIEPYWRHASSTSATKAEGRALRKGLRLRTLAAEETQTPSTEESRRIDNFIKDVQPASDNQKNLIKKLIGDLGIKSTKLFKSISGLEEKTVETISFEEAQALLRKLNLYSRPPQQGGEIVPEDFFVD